MTEDTGKEIEPAKIELPKKEALTLSQDKEKDPSKAPKLIPIENIIVVFENNPNISYEDAGKIIGMTGVAIKKRLDNSGYTPSRIKAFRKSEKTVQQLLRAKMANAINLKDLDGESLWDLVKSYGVMFDKEHGTKVTVEGTLAVKALEAQESTLAEESQALITKLEAQGMVIDLTPEATEDGIEPIYSVDGESGGIDK